MYTSRHLSQLGNRPVKVVAVTSGKGGVGKTNVSVNLGVTLSNMGRSVMLMDADLGLANVDVVLGLHATANLSHVIRGECRLADIILAGPGGLKVVPAASGLQAMAELPAHQHAGVIRAFSDLNQPLDYLLIDTAAGISENVIAYTKAAHEVLIVVLDEPASITDAYALIKLLNRDHGVSRFQVLPNMVPSLQVAKELYLKLVKVTDRYLDVVMNFAGMIPMDPYFKQSIRRQRAIVDLYPRSKASLAFKKLAQKADTWPMPWQAGGNLEFFVERLLGASHWETGVST